MTGRTYVLIFFFWAALTIITPTLVLWSESIKTEVELNGEKGNRLKDRKLIGNPGAQLTNATVSSNPPYTVAPAPAPATELDLVPGTKQPSEQSLLQSNRTGDPALQKLPYTSL
ncbi:hypothetical protein SLE2022_099580 [Rubroshorea leprosula]